MSYILDALRRADAERDRGAVPGLHAQPVPAGSQAAAGRAAISPGTWVLAIAVVLAVLVAVSWQWLTPETPRVAAAPAAAPLPVPAPPAAAPAPPAPTALAPIPVAKPAPPPAPAKEATSERIYAINELPEAVRRQLPTITVGGSMYSDDPTRRMLIINGQLYHEHDQLAPGVTLEQIKLKAAVLKFQGYRYAINF